MSNFSFSSQTKDSWLPFSKFITNVFTFLMVKAKKNTPINSTNIENIYSEGSVALMSP